MIGSINSGMIDMIPHRIQRCGHLYRLIKKIININLLFKQMINPFFTTSLKAIKIAAQKQTIILSQPAQ
ncbi:hypothetical protein GCM10007984_05700 [Shewanella putrefaciens]|jgi:hypothetical protein|nr:hypothetical protein GCM10007984_05700 [Shewanella putrefaciens]